jgi:hypothetical protein
MDNREQLRAILQLALEQCGGDPAARRGGEWLVEAMSEGYAWDRWDLRAFFARIAMVLGPVNQPIEVIDGQTQEHVTLRFKDAVALLCMRLMTTGALGFRIPNPNVLIPYTQIFRPGIWAWVNKPLVSVVYVPGPEEDVPIPEDVPEIKIPAGQEDVISMTAIPDGTLMVDFHGERAKHRYYTEATYRAIIPKKNPYTRQTIEPNQVTRYIAKLDSTLPVQEAGRRRKTRKYKRRAKKTRRHK